VAALGRLKGGKPDGLWTLWRDDGQKEEEIYYADGVRVRERPEPETRPVAPRQ
jgi:antitoxin component YwqK of YwqJK toxin-antitoxin module